MAVAKQDTSAWMRRPGFTAAVIFLHCGLMWVAAAGCLARVIGRRFFGEVQGSPMLSAEASVVRCSLTFAVLLGPAALMLVHSRGMWSMSKHSKKGIKDPLAIVVIGGIVLLAFMVLIAAADFVVPLQGSQSARVGSICRPGASGCLCSTVFHHHKLHTHEGSEAADDEVEGISSCVVET